MGTYTSARLPSSSATSASSFACSFIQRPALIHEPRLPSNSRRPRWACSASLRKCPQAIQHMLQHGATQRVLAFERSPAHRDTAYSPQAQAPACRPPIRFQQPTLDPHWTLFRRYRPFHTSAVAAAARRIPPVLHDESRTPSPAHARCILLSPLHCTV